MIRPVMIVGSEKISIEIIFLIILSSKCKRAEFEKFKGKLKNSPAGKIIFRTSSKPALVQIKFSPEETRVRVYSLQPAHDYSIPSNF